MDLELSDAELERYSRQLILPEFGIEEQLKLKAAHTLIVGAGALGSIAAGYLAAAGVGRIGIVDDETVDLSNLQRQLLHFGPDIGRNKAESLTAKLGLLNPEALVESFPARLVSDNASALLTGHDVVVDCSDNFATRYLVNAVCVREQIDLVEAGVVGLVGLVATIRPGKSACYSCMFPPQETQPQDESCAQAGILGPAAGIVGSAQAAEAIKLLTGVGKPLTDQVLQIDLTELTVRSVKALRDPSCPVCAV